MPWPCIEDNPIVKCISCGAKQCFRHQAAWHEGYTCEQWDEELDTKKKRSKEDKKSKDLIDKTTKVCPGPGCGRRVSLFFNRHDALISYWNNRLRKRQVVIISPVKGPVRVHNFEEYLIFWSACRWMRVPIVCRCHFCKDVFWLLASCWECLAPWAPILAHDNSRWSEQTFVWTDVFIPH